MPSFAFCLSLYFWWANSATYSFLTVKSELSSSTVPLLTSLCMVFVETPILSDISLCVFFSFKLASIIHLSTSVKCLPFFFLCYNKSASVTFRYFLFLHKSNYNMNGNSMLFYFLLSGHFILQLILLVFRQKRRTPASKHKKSSKMKETCSFLIF